MNSTIVRKLSDGEELVVVGHVGITTASHTNPRDPSIERRSQALSDSSRAGSAQSNLRPRRKA